MRTQGILLAGGQSRRFGSPKAFAQHEGEYFYALAYRALSSVCDDVLIVTLAELQHRFPAHLHVVPDSESYRGDGPLAGIYTAMTVSPAERYIVLPCDMPYMTAEVLARFVGATGAKEAYAVRTASHQHPLVSCLSHRVLPTLEAHLAAGQKGVIAFLEEVGVQWLDGELFTAQASRVFCNVNHPEPLKEGNCHA